jgi:hypothetical protein
MRACRARRYNPLVILLLRRVRIFQGLTFPLYNDRYPNELLECLRMLSCRTDDVTRSDGSRVPLDSVLFTTPINDDIEASGNVLECSTLDAMDFF